LLDAIGSLTDGNRPPVASPSGSPRRSASGRAPFPIKGEARAASWSRAVAIPRRIWQGGPGLSRGGVGSNPGFAVTGGVIRMDRSREEIT